MKNYYFITVLGLLLIGCSADNDDLEGYSDELLSRNAIVECDFIAGSDKSVTLTNSYVRKNLYGVSLLEKYYLSLLDEGVPRTGTFSPSIYSLVRSYKENNLQTFTTTYSVTENGCMDSAVLSIQVVLLLDPVPCSAGEDKSVTLTNGYVRQNLYGVSLLEKYYLSLLDEGVPRNGVFNPSIYSIVRSYKDNNFQSFTTIYTISGSCDDSVSLTIQVIP